MIKNTCKTVDQVYGILRAAYLAWEIGVKPTKEVVSQVFDNVGLGVFGLACMRAQRQTTEEKWGEFFTALWDTAEGYANV